MIKGQKGYVRLYRDIMDWGWYEDASTVRLFIHCILKANYDDNVWKGIKIPRGSFVTSYAKLAEELKLTQKKIRIALEHLKTTNTVSHKTTTQYSIITVNNYDTYQTMDTQTVKQKANDGQTDGTQRATTNKRNNGKKEEINYHYDVFEKLRAKAIKEGKI